MYTPTFCVCFCCSKIKRKLLKALIPALSVKYQWLALSALISCSHANKEIIQSSVNSWHTRNRPFYNHNADSRIETKHFLNFFNHTTTTWYLV